MFIDIMTLCLFESKCVYFINGHCFMCMKTCISAHPTILKPIVYHLLLKNLLQWVLPELLGSYWCCTHHASCGIFLDIQKSVDWKFCIVHYCVITNLSWKTIFYFHVLLSITIQTFSKEVFVFIPDVLSHALGFNKK